MKTKHLIDFSVRMVCTWKVGSANKFTSRVLQAVIASAPPIQTEKSFRKNKLPKQFLKNKFTDEEKVFFPWRLFSISSSFYVVMVLPSLAATTCLCQQTTITADIFFDCGNSSLVVRELNRKHIFNWATPGRVTRWLDNLVYTLSLRGKLLLFQKIKLLLFLFFKNGPMPASILFNIVPFKHKSCRKTAGFSGIQTRIVKMEGGHDDHHGPCFYFSHRWLNCFFDELSYRKWGLSCFGLLDSDKNTKWQLGFVHTVVLIGCDQCDQIWQKFATLAKCKI